MKLSRTGWNNVIIFSVMIIILLINSTNNRLFPNEDTNNSDKLLPEHSVILTLTVNFPDQTSLSFERVGRAWKMTSHGRLVDLNNQQIEQMMFTWQQSSGLVQAGDMVIDGIAGVNVDIGLAGNPTTQRFTLYPLVDQLLVSKPQQASWLALPKAVSRQLLPSLSHH